MNGRLRPGASGSCNGPSMMFSLPYPIGADNCPLLFLQFRAFKNFRRPLTQRGRRQDDTFHDKGAAKSYGDALRDLSTTTGVYTLLDDHTYRFLGAPAPLNDPTDPSKARFFANAKQASTKVVVIDAAFLGSVAVVVDAASPPPHIVVPEDAPLLSVRDLREAGLTDALLGTIPSGGKVVYGRASYHFQSRSRDLKDSYDLASQDDLDHIAANLPPSALVHAAIMKAAVLHDNATQVSALIANAIDVDATQLEGTNLAGLVGPTQATRAVVPPGGFPVRTYIVPDESPEYEEYLYGLGPCDDQDQAGGGAPASTPVNVVVRTHEAEEMDEKMKISLARQSVFSMAFELDDGVAKNKRVVPTTERFDQIVGLSTAGARKQAYKGCYDSAKSRKPDVYSANRYIADMLPELVSKMLIFDYNQVSYTAATTSTNLGGVSFLDFTPNPSKFKQALKDYIAATESADVAQARYRASRTHTDERAFCSTITALKRALSDFERTFRISRQVSKDDVPRVLVALRKVFDVPGYSDGGVPFSLIIMSNSFLSLLPIFRYLLLSGCRLALGR